MKKVFKLDFLGRDLIVETGELAKQADGADLSGMNRGMEKRPRRGAWPLEYQ